MADEGCGVVLWDACAFTLGDEPLAGAVEHGAVQTWVSLSETCVTLHNLIHSQLWKEPTLGWQSSIQKLLKGPMQRHLPLCSLGLQQADLVGSDLDEAAQVPLGGDVFRHEPADLP